VTDLETRRIPNVIVLPSTAIVLVARIALGHGNWWEWPIAGIAAAALLLVAAILSRGGVGMGDVKLALFLGCALGSATPTALLIGFATAALYSGVLLVMRGRSALRSAFPLAPFLALGGCIAVLFT
jgi:prepilin signal peptidase PulO-like enzyme (type II secretory pathway)